GALAAVHQVQRAIGKPAAGLDVGQMLGKAMAPDLELSYRHAEGAAIVAVLDGPAQAFLHRRQRSQRSHQALSLKVLHDVVEAAVLLAEKVAQRQAAFVEEQLGGIGSQVTDLLELFSHGEALGLRRK